MQSKQSCSLTERELMVALKELEVMIQSLHRVGSFFDQNQQACDEETIKIIDGYRYVQRLSRVRATLLKAGRRAFGAEHFERNLESLGRVRHWNKPGDLPPV